MNFKQIVSSVNQLASLQGVVATVGATTYQSVIAEKATLSFVMLQMDEPEWKFMRDSVSFTTSSLQEEYTFSEIMTAANKSYDIRKINEDLVFIAGRKMSEMDYDEYRYLELSDSTSGMKDQFVVKPHAPRSIIIPNVASLETVSFDFWRSAQYLSKDADVPILPSDYHYLIVLKTLREVLAEYGHQSMFDRYADLHDELDAALRRNQLPEKVREVRPLYRGRRQRI